jgi:hypothetical protein
MKIIILVMAALLISSPVFAEEQRQQGKDHVFTNRDLKNFNHSSASDNQGQNDGRRAAAGDSDADLKPVAVSQDKVPKKTLKQTNRGLAPENTKSGVGAYQ